MDLKFLDFEQPIADLEAKIDELKFVGDDSELNISEEISRLRRKSDILTRSIFSKLSAWQIAQLARHPHRPYMLDYVRLCFTDFQELHGDRMYADDKSLVGGIGRLEGQPVVIIGHQKGRDTKERVRRNYGMARPEGYRKALRLLMCHQDDDQEKKYEDSLFYTSTTQPLSLLQVKCLDQGVALILLLLQRLQ